MSPPREDAPAVASSTGREGKDQQRDQIVALLGDKRIASLQARAALAGVELHRLDDGRWLAARWSYSRTLTDAEIEPWLRMVAGGRP